MKTHLIQIGNSKGIRISKSLIEQFDLDGEIEIIPSSKGLLIKPLSKPRSKWEDMFSAAVLTSGKKDESAEWKNISNKFDKEEWTW